MGDLCVASLRAAFLIGTVGRASMDSVVSRVPLENWPFILISYNLKSQLWFLQKRKQPGIEQGIGPWV